MRRRCEHQKLNPGGPCLPRPFVPGTQAARPSTASVCIQRPEMQTLARPTSCLGTCDVAAAPEPQPSISSFGNEESGPSQVQELTGAPLVWNVTPTCGRRHLSPTDPAVLTPASSVAKPKGRQNVLCSCPSRHLRSYIIPTPETFVSFPQTTGSSALRHQMAVLRLRKC